MRKKLAFYVGRQLVWLVVWLLRWTCRVRVYGQAPHSQQPVVYALWHEDLLASLIAHRFQRLTPLASLSKDGDIVTYVLQQLGYDTIRGSSSRGGEEARHQLVAKIDAGWSPTITVDGPRGPRRMVKGGVVDVARRSGIPVVAMLCRSPRSSRLRSWDLFCVPWPFSTIEVRYSEPMRFAADVKGQAFGQAKQQVKSALLALEQQESLRATLQPEVAAK